MGIVDKFKTAAEELINKEETPQSPVVPQESETHIQPEVTDVKDEEAPAADRSAYNCPTCGGEGLVKDTFEEGRFIRCPQCSGTGKV